MMLGNLVRWGKWFYLATMEALYVFHAETGRCVSKWYVWAPHNVEYKRWHFYCNVNTLPEADSNAFQAILRDWERYVDEKLTQAYGGGY